MLSAVPFVKLAALYTVVLVSEASAGPACARRLRDKENCMAICASRWGWPGKAMGTDPWGVVMTPDASRSNAILADACGISTLPAAGNSSDQNTTVVTSAIVSTFSTSTTFSTSFSGSSAVTAFTFAPVTTSTSTEETSSESTTTSTSTSTPRPEPTTTAEPPPPTTTSTQPPTTQQEPPPPSTEPPRTTPIPRPTSTPSSSPPVQTPPANSDNFAGNSDISQYLAGHNNVRARHGAAPLAWSDELAGKAQEWANGCRFQHSGGTLGRFGENLAAGTGDEYDIAAAIKSWTDEVVDYNSGNPQASHFTQVVWRATTQVGCALQLCDGIFAASFGRAKFYVCEYSPAGNVIGQFADNVQV